jgi:hypothetical protein
LTQEEYDDPRFAYRLLFTRKVVGKKGQADRAIEFLRPGDPGADDVDPEHWLIKDTERVKYRAKAVIEIVKSAGYPFFGIYQHTTLWRRLDGKNPDKGFGTMVVNEWFWYETWIEECKRQCQAIVEAQIAIVAPRPNAGRS